MISNASDALDRLRFKALTRPKLIEDDAELEIRFEADCAGRILTINVSDIGMSRKEVIEHIGAIAKSGTRELREMMKEGASDKVLEELIGQSELGFYSAFMVAERVTRLTRRAGEEKGTR